ncbi:MAG: hypothetical protein J6Q81_02135 [Lentisphaeria bacterium]|nr:hypothetical protein [Lentisphaeria bacterium]
MKYFFSLILLTAALLLSANDDSGKSAERSERWRGKGGRSMRRGGGFMEQIKKKYPKEFAEIEKLQESDPEKARSKMRDLMRKSMPDFGMMRRSAEPSAEQLKELKAKYPAEFAEYEKLKASDEEKAKDKLRELLKKHIAESAAGDDKFLRDRNRRATAHVLAELKIRYPEKMKNIEELQQTDPDTARAELRKLFAESQMRMPGGQKVLEYEYIPPQQQPNGARPWGMNRGGFPFGGNRMMGPWGGRR